MKNIKINTLLIWSCTINSSKYLKNTKMKYCIDDSYNFCEKVVEILNLGDFKYSKKTWHTKVNVSSTQRKELYDLCVENNRLRNIQDNPKTNWSFGVLELYFNIYF